jgi:hypothetical protein
VLYGSLRVWVGDDLIGDLETKKANTKIRKSRGRMDTIKIEERDMF